MNSTAAQVNRSQANYPAHLGSSKSLGAAGNQPTGAAGQGNVAGECARWIEQNVNLYNSIVSGTSGLSQQDQAQFMDWYRYAYQTAFGGGQAGSDWGGGVYPQGQMGGMPGQQLPPGAKMGANGNIFYNTGKGEFTYTERVAQPIDVSSDEFTLNVATTDKVDIEKTTDSRLKPAQEVYKVTIHDSSAKGGDPQNTVIFLSPETKLNINTVNGKRVTFHGGIEKSTVEGGQPRFTVGTYTEEATGENGMSGVESSVSGKEDPLKPGTFEYRLPIGEDGDIDFQALPGKTQTHVVWADANIKVANGDSAECSIDATTGEMTIKVTHASDGTTDTYLMKKGFDAQLNIKKEYLTFNPPSKDGKMPDAFKDRLKVPDLGAGSAGGTAAPGKVETGKGPEADAKVQAFMSAFTDPPITLDDIKNAGLVDEIAYGASKPSEAMLSFIFTRDNACKTYQGKMELLVKRMATFLQKLGYQAEGAKQVANEKDFFALHLNNLTINGTTYNLNPNNLDDWKQGFKLNPITVSTE